MKSTLLIAGILSLHMLLTGSEYSSEAVIVSVPCADAVGEPLQPMDPAVPVEELYKKLAWSFEQAKCFRIHQLLFNEIGTVKKIEGEEILVEFSHFFWYNKLNEHCNCVWLLKKNVLWLKDIEDKQSIPQILSESATCLNGILTLTMPWEDPDTHICYSAGTRFVRDVIADNEQHFGICLLLSESRKSKKALVPKELCIVDYPKSEKEIRHHFVALLKKWAHLPSGVVGYVHGGTSFIEPVRSGDFFLSEQEKNWQRPPAGFPHCGFDCSGLLLRALQILGVPYFYKNTTTIGRHLKDLSFDEALQEGDLMLTYGHVAVVADVKQNTLIESVGYGSGFGELQEIALPLRVNIESWDQLRKWVCNPVDKIHYKTKQGGVYKAIESMRFLKLLDGDA